MYKDMYIYILYIHIRLLMLTPGMAALRNLVFLGLFRDVDDVDIYVHGNFYMVWGGGVELITFNRLRSLILRLAFPIVISNTILLLRYEEKNVLTRS